MKVDTQVLRAYFAVSAVAAPLYRLIQSRRLKAGKEHPDRKEERFGTASAARPNGRLIWFHAASVGESLSLVGLIRALLDDDAQLHVLVTTNTLTSANLLADLLPSRAFHQFVPYDARAAVRRFLSHWYPDLAVWTESELWPQLLYQTDRSGVPMLLINARVSQKTMARWRRWPHTARALLAPFRAILVQEEASASVMRDIGVPAEIITVTGSLKEELPPLGVNPDVLTDLASRLGDRPRWLAASTHEGEDAIIVAAHRRAFGQAEGAPLLIIAPRHPGRGPALAKVLAADGLKVALRSNGDQPQHQTDVYVADTLGEMGLWYRLCRLAFVGGSLVKAGGHNPYEPVQLGCAVIHGPHVFNFAEIYTRLAKADGAVSVTDVSGIAEALLLLEDNRVINRQTQAARDVLEQQGSATGHALTAISHQLSSDTSRASNRQPVLSVNQIDVIIPNFKRRLSGVTATIVRLVPLQAAALRVAVAAPEMPDTVPQVPLLSLLTMSRRGPSVWRVWHARRNIEMLAGLALSRLLGKRLKFVFTSASQRRHTWLTRALIRRMDVVVSTSEKTARYLECPSHVIYHGIDNATFAPVHDRAFVRGSLGLPPDGVLIGCYGRIRAQKGTDLFVEAAIRLCGTFPALRAVVVGRAVPKDEVFLATLKDSVRAAGLADRILFRDEVPVWEMPNWYGALDVYVAPQRWEGFGLTPLEAMACGVPVVATDVGAFRELVRSGETGFIVAPDSADRLEKAVADLLSDPDRLDAFRKAARTHVERHFDIRTEAAALIRLYSALLADVTS